MKYFVILVTFSGFIGNSKSFFGHYVNGNFHEDPVEEFTAELKTDLLNVVEEKWIEQRLNHFDMQDIRSWQMRYLENLEFFQVGGPIFVYVGGEWEIHKSRLLGGYLFDLAQEFNASLFYTEHRYYGKSHPTKNTSTKNLKYLTTDQALADLAHFITVTRKTIPGLENSKVFLMGGSYAGTVVTWFRLKYPHLADAAWASSAPLFATLDFGEFNEVMTESLQKVATPKCFNIFKSAFEQMDKLAESGDYSKLNKFFNTCQPLKAEDLKHFFYELTDHVASFIQVYNPTKMKAACNFLVHNNFPDPILAFALWFNGLSKNCFDASYASAVETHTQTSWNSTANKQSEIFKFAFFIFFESSVLQCDSGSISLVLSWAGLKRPRQKIKFSQNWCPKIIL